MFFFQHYINSPSALLFSSTDCFQLKISFPYHQLGRLIQINSGELRSEVGHWMHRYSSNFESISSALLISSLNPRVSHWGLFIASLFSQSLQSEHFDPLVEAIFSRSLRTVAFLYDQPLFKLSSAKQYQISHFFSLDNSRVIHNLLNLIGIIDFYISSKYKNNFSADSAQLLVQLKKILLLLSEMISFLYQISLQRPQDIHKAFQRLTTSQSNRLSKEPLGSDHSGEFLIDSLSYFCSYFFLGLAPSVERDSFAAKIASECSNIFNISSSKLELAITDLSVALTLPIDSRDDYLFRALAIIDETPVEIIPFDVIIPLLNQLNRSDLSQQLFNRVKT